MEINYSKLTATQVAKLRFQEAKAEAIQNGISQTTFLEFVTSTEPCYNSVIGWERVKNVWLGRSADIRLTELIQEMNNKLISK